VIDLERRDPAPRAERLDDARPSRARRWATAVAVGWAILFVAEVVLIVAPVADGPGRTPADLLFAVATATFAIAGIAIMRRLPENRIAWILVAIGVGWTGGEVLGYVSDIAIARGWAGGAALSAVSASLWLPPIMLMGTSLLLRFPDGELPSSRWRPVERLALIAGVISLLAITLLPGPMTEAGHPELRNPLGIDSLEPVIDMATALIVVLPLLIVASAVSLVLRFRRSRGVERLQLKWLVAAGAIVAVLYLVAMISSIQVNWLMDDTPGWAYALQVISLGSFVLIPAAIGIAVLRYRLYGIDVVINKALVYGSLAAFITVAYAAIVVGAGHLLGRTRDVGLSVAATALVAVAFQPVKDRVQRLANRLVYGRRAAPYEVLANVSSRMTGAFETEDVLPRLARLLVDGTGASRVEVWLRVGDRLRLAAESPHRDAVARALTLERGELPAIPDASFVAVVRDEGELFGAIALRKSPGDPVTPPEQALTEDVGRQAALLLRNARLIEELRASRERIVAAQDDERRRLERDIHDGAQQQLVTLSLSTRLVQSELGSEAPAALTDLLDRAIEESKQALAELRELARGIHPRILTERGLPAAIRSLAERAPVPVAVDADGDGRLPEAIEATAYFAVSEALQNVAKYANATGVEIRAARENGSLVVHVSDDGVGGADASRGSGLRGLLDRIDAVGGRLELDSPPGRGTRLTVVLPAA
jgi:signal transduction histidine kinase